MMGWLLGALGIGGFGAALIFIPGFAANALRALGAALDVVRRSPWQCAVLALVLASAWLWRGWDRADGRTAAALEQVAKWKAANEAATQWALAEKRAKETAANDIKDNANDRRKDAQTAGARAGADYRRANQCVRVTPAEGGGLNPDLPRPDSVAGQSARPEPDAELVAVRTPDFNTCTSAVIDLGNARDWAADMVAKGLAK